MNEALIRYDNKSLKDADGNVYNGYIYSNKSADKGVYVAIRVNAGDLSQYGRSAAGVIVMRLDEGSYVVNFAKVEKQDEEESAEEQA